MTIWHDNGTQFWDPVYRSTTVFFRNAAVWDQPGREEFFQVGNGGDAVLSMSWDLGRDSPFEFVRQPPTSLTVGAATFSLRLKPTSGIFFAQSEVRVYNNSGGIGQSPFTFRIYSDVDPLRANAGPNQSVEVGQDVQLQGGGQFPVSATYSWSFTSWPGSSTPALRNPTTLTPIFTPGVAGTYTLRLVISYEGYSSAPSFVTITARQSSAELQMEQLFVPGDPRPVRSGDTLDFGTVVRGQPFGATKSFRIRNTGTDPLRFNTVITPPGLNASLLPLSLQPGGVQPFDLTLDTSTPQNLDDRVQIFNNSQQNPFFFRVIGRVVDVRADAGRDDTVQVSQEHVLVDGRGSTPPEGPGVSYRWEFLAYPGQRPALSDADRAVARFLPDRSGDYELKLTVSALGRQSEDTVRIRVEKDAKVTGQVVLTDWRAKGPRYGGGFAFTTTSVERAVTLRNVATGAERHTRVDTSTGHFEFADVPGGTYTVTAFTHPGGQLVADGRFRADPIQVSVPSTGRVEHNFVLTANHEVLPNSGIRDIGVGDIYELYSAGRTLSQAIRAMAGPAVERLGRLFEIGLSEVVDKIAADGVLRDALNDLVPAVIRIEWYGVRTWDPRTGEPISEVLDSKWTFFPSRGGTPRRWSDRATDDQLVIRAHSPVSLVVEDGTGRRAGRDAVRGVTYTDLPALYHESAGEKILWLTSDAFSPGYKVYVYGTGTGTYSLDVTGYRNFPVPVEYVAARPVTAGQVDVFTVSTPSVSGERSQVARVRTVTTAADSGPGSLRQAILDANADPGVGRIVFAIGSGRQTIPLTTPLPALTRSMIIDGTTQPGYSGSPLIELDGSAAGPGANGLRIAAGSCVVRGLVINRFAGAGIEVTGAGSNVIENNCIGTDRNGVGTLSSDNYIGVLVSDSPNNTIGGLALGAGNAISGNRWDGVQITGSRSSGNRVLGNLIGPGLAAQDQRGVGNNVGVRIYNAPDNVVGGTEAGAGNVISDNSAHGITIHGSAAAGNRVQQNLVGLDPSGTRALGNGQIGVDIWDGAHDNLVGGTTAAARNKISGNATGVVITYGASGNRVMGNYIGTDASGTRRLGNSVGVRISERYRNTANNVIGGTEPGAGNLISGNVRQGITLFMAGASGTQVMGNYIGTDARGTGNLGNGAEGISVSDGSRDNRIGGLGAGNVIAFNGKAGVAILDGTATGNRIVGNSIHSNSGLGIDLGSAEPPPSTYNEARQTYLPISRSGDGPTSNDPLDMDGGPNGLLNHPVLTTVFAGAQSRVVGTLHSRSRSAFTVDIYAGTIPGPDGFVQASRYLGAALVATDFDGNGAFDIILTSMLHAGEAVTATASDQDGNTSEFSLAYWIGTGPSVAGGSGGVVPASSPSQQPASSGDSVASADTTSGAGGTLTAQATAVGSRAPMIQSVVINDGSSQRSMVTSITITFNDIVAIGTKAFTLKKRGGQGIGLNLATSVVDGKTVAVLTFKGRKVIGGALPDGDYQLTINAKRIHDSADQYLDGNRDGIAGGNYVEAFFRQYGDTNGDHVVDDVDRAVFALALDQRRGDTGYLWYLDFEDDGAIVQSDLNQVMARFRFRGKRRRGGE